MKFFIVLTTIAALAASQKYTSENDNFDIEALVNNKDKLEAFLDCFLDKGPCDEVSQDFKKDLGEAVKESCAKCTDAQKHILKRFLDSISEKLPVKLEDFKRKYDPENKYFTALQAAIANA